MGRRQCQTNSMKPLLFTDSSAKYTSSTPSVVIQDTAEILVLVTLS